MNTQTTIQQTLRVLRASQSRSAREQQIISGRDWLFVSALVQLLSALYPAYVWMSNTFFVHSGRAPDPNIHHVTLGMLVTSAVLLFLWIWAKYAPFRSACAALSFYLVLQLTCVFLQPHRMTEGIAVKICILLGLVMAVRVGHRRRHSG
ncbi:MAG: hypothetical protein LBR12_06105 [Opitutaceae bacterium]|jgi:hypothetical protein|nr:hypothetical protein [Opitutaceae bacterium]